jgi:hypothetical protein
MEQRTLEGRSARQIVSPLSCFDPREQKASIPCYPEDNRFDEEAWKGGKVSYVAVFIFPNEIEKRDLLRFATQAEAKRYGQVHRNEMVPQAVGQRNINGWVKAKIRAEEVDEPPTHRFNKAGIIEPC